MGASTFTPLVDKFRFYEDGTESGSSPAANEDTNISGRNVNSDSKIHVRYRIQESGGKSGNAGDDWNLQYQIDGGGFTNVTTTSTGVKVDTGSSLTDGSATTNRATNGITDGTGSFVASQQEEGDGQITNFQLTASNFTEAVWAVTLVSAGLTNGNVIQFRVSLNGGSPGVTNSVTPQITVSKTVAATLNAEPATFTITASAVTNVRAQSFNAAAASFTLTGADTTNTVDRPVNAAAGSFSLSGADIGFVQTLSLNAAAGTFTLTGADANIGRDKFLTAEPASFTLTGADTTNVAAYNLNAGPASISLSGADTTNTVDRPVNAAAGTFSLTGADATFSVSSGTAAYSLNAEPGAFALSGMDAGLLLPSAESTRRTGGAAGKKHRKGKRRIIILPSEDGYEEVSVRDVPEQKPLTFALRKIFVDATTEYTKPKMADVDEMIARMAEYKQPVMPKVKQEYYDQEDEDEEWLMLH